MKTFFPDNNLPPQAQDWVNKLEREIAALKRQISQKPQVQVVETIVQVKESDAKISRLEETVKSISEMQEAISDFEFVIDGGHPESNYGAIAPIDGGGASAL